MYTPGINNTTFELVFNKSFFKRGGILIADNSINDPIMVHDRKDDHITAVSKYIVQTMENLRVEKLHFKFLLKYKLI